jgi:hypothetical protein
VLQVVCQIIVCWLGLVRQCDHPQDGGATAERGQIVWMSGRPAGMVGGWGRGGGTLPGVSFEQLLLQRKPIPLDALFTTDANVAS